MRVFGIEDDGAFTEYGHVSFEVEHEEKTLEDWLESNPDGILEDSGVLVIGRQVRTNLGGFIDLLGVDRAGDTVVVELKRDRSPRDTIAQSLEYASFVERLGAGQLEGVLRSYMNDELASLAEYHRAYFDLGDAAVAFNKDQRIVVIGQRITPEIRQTAAFLCSKGARVTCVEFTFFRSQEGSRLMSQEIVVGEESRRPVQVSSESRTSVTEEQFLEACDENGRAVFSRMLELSREKSMPIHWGSKGFSVNVDLDGTHVAFCYGYPPDSVFKQCFYAALRDARTIGKTAIPEEVVQELKEQVQGTGLFIPAGQSLKCPIERRLTDTEVGSLLDWCEAVADAIREHGLR